MNGILGLVGYDARLTRERSRVQSSEDVLLHFYAPTIFVKVLVEHFVPHPHNTLQLYMNSILGLVGYDARLTRERSRVQSSEDVFSHMYLSALVNVCSCLLITSVYSSVVEYLPSKQVARVRFPVDAFFLSSPIFANV